MAKMILMSPPEAVAASIQNELDEARIDEIAASIRTKSNQDPKEFLVADDVSFGSGFDSGRGVVTMWHTGAGDPAQRGLSSEVPIANIRPTLKMRADGQPVWSITPIERPFRAGTLVCLLNPESPEYERLREMGVYHECTVPRFKSAFDLEQHMKKRHREEWATLQSVKEREMAESQVAMAKAMVALAEKVAS
jgi:hypothetical protein